MALIKFLNRIFESPTPEYINTINVENFETAVQQVQMLIEQEHNLDIFCLVDLDKTLNDEKYNHLVTLPGISFLTWHLLNPEQVLYPENKMIALKKLSNITNVGIATNRREDSHAFQSDFLMKAFYNALQRYEIEIPIFSRLSKQLQSILPSIREYNDKRLFHILDNYLPKDDYEIPNWIYEERNNGRDLMIVSISDIDGTNPSNLGFLDSIIKMTGEKKVKGLRIDIKKS